jgi:mRNA interferase ChpB
MANHHAHGQRNLVAERGDIWHVDLNPIKGREQAGPRYILVLSPSAFNQLGIVLAVPITSGGEFARVKGFTVSLAGIGLKTDGVILCHQIRALDLKERGARFYEKAPDYVTEEVLAKLNAILA